MFACSMESESGNFNTNMCEFIGTSGEKTMVRDHLVQPAHSTDEEIKTQRKKNISQAPGASGATLHLLPPNPHISDLSLLPPPMSKQLGGLQAGRCWKSGSGRHREIPFPAHRVDGKTLLRSHSEAKWEPGTELSTCRL